MGTKQIEVFRVCDICTAETRAVETNRIALNGDTYEVDTCEKHDTALNDAVMKFALQGTQIRKASFLDKPKAPTSAVVPIRREIPVHHTEARPQREELPETAKTWTLTTHAEERMVERGFDIYEVLMTAERPKSTTDDGNGDPAVRIHHRPDLDCYLAVNVKERVVLTVKRHSTFDPSLKASAGVR